MKAALIVLGALALLALGLYSEISVWNECRASHSWFYCYRTLHQ